MKVFVLIFLLSATTFAQEVEGIKDWKFIREMSGAIPDHPGLTLETYAAQVARGDKKVKLIMRWDFPEGAPVDIFRDAMPYGFDVSSVQRFVGAVEFNCETLVIKPVGGTGTVIQFNGKRHKTKEPPVSIGAGHIFSLYFCERGAAPVTAPTMNTKPKPTTTPTPTKSKVLIGLPPAV